MEWEQIDAYHQRTKVFGGWLVKSYEDVVHYDKDVGILNGYSFTASMAFVPDPKHEWEVK